MSYRPSGLPRKPGFLPYIFSNLVPLKRRELAENRKEAQGLVEGSNFTVNEIQKLLLFMKQITPRSKPFDRLPFRQFVHSIFGIHDDIIQDRVFRMFDRNRDGNLDGGEWIHGMSLLMRGTDEEQSKFVFEVYDLQDDGVISREEIFSFLRNSLVKLPDDEDKNEAVHDLVEMAHKKLDVDRDGAISLKDFQAGAKKQRLLLQCLGRCLPRSNSVTAFMGVLSQFNELLQ